MRYLPIAVAIFAGAFSAGLLAQSAVRKAPSLDGRWEVATINGAAPDAMMGGALALVFKGDAYEQFTAGKLSEEGTLKFDLTKTPAHIDLIIKTGPDAGKTQLGLFEMKGDVMALTLGQPDGAERPASLAAGPYVVVANRKK